MRHTGGSRGSGVGVVIRPGAPVPSLAGVGNFQQAGTPAPPWLARERPCGCGGHAACLGPAVFAQVGCRLASVVGAGRYGCIQLVSQHGRPRSSGRCAASPWAPVTFTLCSSVASPPCPICASSRVRWSSLRPFLYSSHGVFFLLTPQAVPVPATAAHRSVSWGAQSFCCFQSVREVQYWLWL
jgi:hypothetical protein